MVLAVAGSCLAACSRVDADQARICRSTLPALVAPGARAEVVRSESWFEPRSIRVEFNERGADGAARRRFALCRFAGEGASAAKSELVALATDRGPVGGASLYLLRHYYLDTAEGAAGDPGSGPAAPPGPEIPPGLARLAQPLLSGLPLAAIYGLLAAAYALVFGLVGRINVAFGAIASVGGLAATVAVVAIGSQGVTTSAGAILLGTALACLTAGWHGLVVGEVAFAAVPARLGQASLIATVGLSLFLMEYLRVAGGAVPVWIPPLAEEGLRLAHAGGYVVTVAPVGLLVAVTALATGLALLVFMRLSRFGREWRAVAQDARAAALFGVDEGRLRRATLGLASGLAGLGGALVAVQFGALGYAGGFDLGLKALAAAVLGGLGSVPGALAGGLAIGLFEIVWQTYCPIAGRDLALYAVLVGAVVLVPGGLARDPQAAERI